MWIIVYHSTISYHPKLHIPKTDNHMTKVLFLLCYHSKLHTPKTWTIRHCSILCCVTIQNYIHLKPILPFIPACICCVTIQNYIHLKPSVSHLSTLYSCVTIQNYIHLKLNFSLISSWLSCVTIQNYIHLKLFVFNIRNIKSCVTIQNYIHLKPQFYIFYYHSFSLQKWDFNHIFWIYQKFNFKQ